MTKRTDFEVPPDARRGTCSTCGAVIVWLRTGERADGSPKWMPIDAATIREDLTGELRGESHFAHCEQAAEHRRAR